MTDRPGPAWTWVKRAWGLLVALWIGAAMRQPGTAHLVTDAGIELLRPLLLAATMALTAVAFALDLRRPQAGRARFGTLAGLIAFAGMLCAAAPALTSRVLDALDELPSVQDELPVDRFPVHTEQLVAYVGIFAVMVALGGLVRDEDRDRARYMPIVIGALAVLLANVLPSFEVASVRAGLRSCYATQKTIAGAIEMYNLDRNTRRTALDRDFFAALKSGGYLQSIPVDAGCRRGSWRHFHDAAGATNGVTCEKHGAIQ